MDIATLGLAVDTRDLAKASGEIDKFAKYGGKAETTAKDIGGAMKAMGREADSASRQAVTALQQLINRTTQVDRAARTASQSTVDWVNALNRQAAAFDDLRASIDPVFAASKKYEAAVEQVNAAVKAGIVTQMEANRVMDLAAQRYLGAGQGMAQTGKSARGMLAAMGGGSNAMRNFSFQLSQVAQQGAVTGNYLGALSIQLPDMLLGFGAVGAAIGAAAAVLAPFVIDLIRGNEAAKDAETAFDDLAGAISEFTTVADQANASLTDLAEKYGENARQVRENYRALAELLGLEAIRDLEVALRSVQEEVTAVTDRYLTFGTAAGRTGKTARDAMHSFAESIDLSVTEVIALSDAFAQLQTAKGLDGATQAAQKLVDFLMDAYGAVENIPEPLREAARQAIEAANAGYLLEEALRKTGENAVTAAGQVGSITEALNAAVEAAINLANAVLKAASALGSLGGTLTNLGGIATMAGTAIEATKNIFGIVSDSEAVKGFAKTISDIGTNLTIMHGSAVRSNAALKDLGSASGGAKKAADKIEEASTAAEALNKALNDAVKSSVEMGSAFGGILVSGIDSFANAFGDLLTGGFKSFKDFASSIVDTFRQMLSQMIAMALKNQILISLGFSADGGLTGGNGLGGILGGGNGKGIFGTIGTLFSKGGLGKIFSGGLLKGIGALLPIAGLALGAFSLLKGAFSRKYYGSGIQGSIGGGGAENLYEFDFFKGGAFKSSKAVYRDLNSEIALFVNKSVADMTTGIRNMADVLGLAADGIEDIEGTRFTIWTNGKSPEEIQEALMAEIAKVGDKMAELVLTTDEFSKEGESALDTLTRLSTSLSAVNDMFDLLERTTYSASLASGDLASKITEAFGGVEAFTAATSNFYDLFFTDAEKMADLTARTAAVFADFHEAMPETREEYRAMVNAIDLTTERGREMYAAFIGLASAMDQILPTLDAVGQLVGALIGRTTTAVDDMINHARDTAREAQNAARLWFTAADRIDAFLSGFNATALSTISPQRRTMEASRSFERILEQIKDGQVDNAADLPNAAREFLSAAAASATTLAEYRRAESRVRNQMELARGISQFEGGAEEVIAHAAERQVEVLQELRDYLQSAEVIKPEDLRQFERELKSIDTAIKFVRDLSYNTLQHQIDLVIKKAKTANLPKDIKRLLLASADGVRTLIDVTLRSDELSPAMKFIVLNGESAHLATLKMLIKDPLPPKLMRAILNESIDLTRQIIMTIKRENLPRDVLEFALVEFANIRRRINLAVKERDPNAIRLALMESDSIRRIFNIAVNEGRLTDSQKSLLRAITGSNFNRVMLEGNFAFDPSRAFSNWFGRTTKGNIEQPMDRLREALRDLIDAVKEQNKAAEIRARVSSLNEFVDANLIQDDKGRYFTDRQDLVKMAEIAGMDTSKYFTKRGTLLGGKVDEFKRQLIRRTTGLADYDLLEKINYDPGYKKRRAFENRKDEKDKLAGLSQMEVDQQLLAKYGGTPRIEMALDIFQAIQENGKLPGFDLTMEQYDKLQEWPADHKMAAFNSYYEDNPGMKKAMGLNMPGIIDYARTWTPDHDNTIDRELPSYLYTPQFARGGMHFGGMRLVGEEGPELEVTGPSRIYSAGQTRNMLDNSAVVAELRMLREEVAELRDENTQLLIRQNRHAKRTTDTLEKWDAIGLPAEQA